MVWVPPSTKFHCFCFSQAYLEFFSSLFTTRSPTAGLSATHVCSDRLGHWSLVAKWIQLLITYLLPIQHTKDKAGWGLSRLESLWIVRTYSELNSKLFNFFLKLNAAGLVDAIVSEDSDSFCYGAQTVLRNFSIAPSGNFVEMFTASRSVFN